jgi:hypothetical protein
LRPTFGPTTALARHECDPSDLISSTKGPSILVSDTGLDRGAIELLRHLDLELEGTRTTRHDAGRAKPHLRNRAEITATATCSPPRTRR